MTEDIEKILEDFEKLLINHIKNDKSPTAALRETEKTMYRTIIITSVSTKSFHNTRGTRGHPRELGKFNASWVYKGVGKDDTLNPGISYYFYNPESNLQLYHEIEIKIKTEK